MRNTNHLRNEMPLGKQSLNDLSHSEKMEYYWQKYKIHIVITVLLACFFGSILHPFLHRKETVLSIAYINAFPNVEDQVIIADFERHLQLNQKRQQVLLDSTYYIDITSDSPYAENFSQKFSDNALSGHFDVVLSDVTNFDYYGNQGFFRDLSTIFSEKELALYQDRLYYLDLPDDNLAQKVPVGIKINRSAKIRETSCYPNHDAYYGVMTDSQRIDEALHFFNYIEH